MADTEDMPASSARPTTEWLWITRNGSMISWGILLLVFVVVWAVKWGGVREPGVIVWGPGRWALGWTPSFLAGLGLPFLWPALRRRAIGRVARIDFLPECIVTGVILVGGESMDWLVPRFGNTAVQTFALSDVAATLAGILGAFLLYRMLISLWPTKPAGKT